MLTNCKVCGKEFDKVIPRHIYCTPKCKQIAWAIKARITQRNKIKLTK